ncbi:HAD family hydrolase [Aliiglaciecola sp. SL4]|uniref:HAD family hydrolase n=1 Tax=Aliiglaciecola sp. SL4 TaxID=3239806 RepID=UPI00355C0D87
MKLPLSEYKTIIFDCDGVILNSNKVKTQAFYLAALPYGEEAANKLVEYHVARGGISRYKKFEWFIESFESEDKPIRQQELLDNYAKFVLDGLMKCEIVNGLAALRQKTSKARWLVASGGDQKELRDVFSSRGLFELFDGGIFGSPDSKDTILEREISNGNILQPALFLGDSKYDHVASKQANLDFVFVNYWTEFKGWEQYCDKNAIIVRPSLESLSPI